MELVDILAFLQPIEVIIEISDVSQVLIFQNFTGGNFSVIPQSDKFLSRKTGSAIGLIDFNFLEITINKSLQDANCP